MKTPFSGGCACGAVRYSCAAEPLYMGNCHCRDCQRATGSAYFAAVIVKKSDFSLTGELAWYEKSADRGHTMGRSFCPSCGSPVLLTNGLHRTSGCCTRAVSTTQAGISLSGIFM